MTVINWLVQQGLIKDIVSWGVGLFMGGVLGTLISLKIKDLFESHKYNQEIIADRLNANTPGGLGEIKRLLAEIEEQTKI